MQLTERLTYTEQDRALYIKLCADMYSPTQLKHLERIANSQSHHYPTKQVNLNDFMASASRRDAQLRLNNIRLNELREAKRIKYKHKPFITRGVATMDNLKVQLHINRTYSQVYSKDSFNTCVEKEYRHALHTAINTVTWGTRVPSTYKLFTLLRNMPVLNTTKVADFLNRKHVAIHGKEVSRSTAERWNNALCNASSAIMSLLNKTHVCANEAPSTPIDVNSLEFDNLLDKRGNPIYDEWCYKG